AKTPSTTNQSSPSTPKATLRDESPPQSAPPLQNMVGSKPTRSPGFSGAPLCKPKPQHDVLYLHRHCLRQ
ncbi:hypothetical protein A2U01_0102305, partial [Trifolium medium]|nr:hypothetical protein [Trifolium medium]